MKTLLSFIILLLIYTGAYAQLKPGFDAQEYLEMLRASKQQSDTALKHDKTPLPLHFKQRYHSPAGPLKNRWDLFTDGQTAAIVIRGTTADASSWMENFYAAMVPASGQLHIDDSTTFKYHLADNPKAAVHIGWLLGMAYLSKTIVPQINKLYTEQHIKDFIIFGHSQGGAIAYLLRSYLADLQSRKIIPADIIFKTYSSAPPKPGNLYYAYDYEYLTHGGWGLAVENTLDWVPETPFSVQTLSDFNEVNPFKDVSKIVGKQKFFVRLYLNHVYNRLKKPSYKAQKNYEKYLGHKVYGFIKKEMPQYVEPEYAATNNYMRCGTPIILKPDANYGTVFPADPKNLVLHHLFYPYYYLTEQNYLHN
ncbi:lipase family protein [Mucilaginibacter jinjuensis]|uniref:Lipase family protein n=1 Tax=Mucilaginibacter jinjuensis TaxID=1176721 RepID=A0ABY7T5Z8_9SPHI|nr:lipase family protein [Mucilaginibacter jinjuensis]WCT11674.1 lipase family protein [Mucilaginibacter jinjuensis]